MPLAGAAQDAGQTGGANGGANGIGGPQVQVANAGQLRDALLAAKGGETILLAEGDYGPLSVSAHYSAPVTIAAASALGARMGDMQISGAENIALHNLDIIGNLRIDRGSSGIAVRNARITGTAYLRNVDGFHLEQTEIRAAQYGLVLNGVRDFVLRGNLIGGAWEDVMRIAGDSYNGLMEYNQILDAVAAPKVHPDLLQMFGLNGKTPHDIVIRRNLFWDDPTTGRPGSMAQGLFITDARSPTGYRNLLIEENLIAVQSTNSIVISRSSSNVVVRNNVLMADHDTDGGAIIRVNTETPGAVMVENNIFKLSLDKKNTATFRDNYVYGRKARLEALFSGPGSRWQDFVPVAGSPIDFGSGLGAESWLREMQSRRTKEQMGQPPRAGMLLPAVE